MGPIRLFISSPTSLNHSAMDYLTILTTRSLVLFGTPPATSSSLAPSPASTPASSPGASVLSLLPPPISIPLLSLMKDDVHCAHFLSNHVLESYGATRETFNTAHDARNRVVQQEAEVLAWQQICRAKTFAQELGRHYGSVDAVHEEELVALAATHGLGLAPIARRHRDRSCDPGAAAHIHYPSARADAAPA